MWLSRLGYRLKIQSSMGPAKAGKANRVQLIDRNADPGTSKL